MTSSEYTPILSKMDNTDKYYSENASNYSYGDLYENYDYYYSQNMSYMEVPLIRQPVHMIIIFSIAYGLVFIFAVVGNFLVIAVIFKTPAMRNVTNYFILNLALADILVAVFVLPITLLANIFSGKYNLILPYKIVIYNSRNICKQRVCLLFSGE